MKIIIIGTYPPTHCGIATFTHDFYQSIKNHHRLKVDILAIGDSWNKIYPSEVKLYINKNDEGSYRKAAEFINMHYDLCILQHEYGIFGGKNGRFILALLHKLHIPLISNLHTILTNPSTIEALIMQKILQKSQHVTVMTPHAQRLLADYYAIPSDKLKIIPHGVPNFTSSQQKAKEELNLTENFVMLSFGFLGRGKGLETAIKALKNVHYTHFKYIILGTTHPNILHEEGEAYREELYELALDLGVINKIKFINQFIDEDTLTQYLSACDIYVTPYVHIQQISSGTLSFALGAGAALLSTPYWYARDLLANDRGILFDFGDAQRLSEYINMLIKDPALLQYYRYNAHSMGKQMSWKQVGAKYITLIEACKLVTSNLN